MKNTFKPSTKQTPLDWAAKEFTHDDIFLMEAGSNSFEIHRRLLALGLRAVVLESAHVGKHAKTYADNDKMAAARIALVYLAGNAPCHQHHQKLPQRVHHPPGQARPAA